MMKLFFTAFCLIGALCGLILQNESEETGQWRTDSRLLAMLDSANMQGVILIYDESRDLWHVSDRSRADKGQLPASTFKIPNSLIALELGLVEDENTIIPWDGKPRRLKAWEEDLSFKEAFHRSCVPCYQELARKTGLERMSNMLTKMAYPGMDVHSDNLDRFWLMGRSRISPTQQIDFLQRLIHEELPLKAHTIKTMKSLMILSEQEGNILRGKTGWSDQDGINNGWFVACLSRGSDNYYIAVNIEPKDQKPTEGFGDARKALAMSALGLKGILH